MNDQKRPCSSQGSGVRAFTVVLLALFLVTVAVFVFFSGKNMLSSNKRFSRHPQEKKVAEKLVFTLDETVLKPEFPEIPETEETQLRKVAYHFGVEDVTGRGDVRASNAKISVDYKVSQNATVGVEARQGMHDSQDAAAWGKSVDDETAAQAKYKLSF